MRSRWGVFDLQLFIPGVLLHTLALSQLNFPMLLKILLLSLFTLIFSISFHLISQLNLPFSKFLISLISSFLIFIIISLLSLHFLKIKLIISKIFNLTNKISFISNFIRTSNLSSSLIFNKPLNIKKKTRYNLL